MLQETREAMLAAKAVQQEEEARILHDPAAEGVRPRC